MPDIEWYRGRAEYLRKLNSDRDDMFDEIDKARKGEWELDDELQQIDWVHKMVDPSFAQASEAATRILADVNPRISLLPYDPEMGSDDKADDHEKGLRWLLDSASRRRAASIVSDVVASAVNYGEVTAQVVYLPQQIKDVKAAGGNPVRWEAMMRHGPFAVIVHNPRNVYAKYSDLGVEEVVLIAEYDPESVASLWPAASIELKKAIEASSGTVVKAGTLYDYVSYDHRCVWYEWGGKDYELDNSEWKWPFLNWVCRIGGTNLEMDTDHARRPLLGNMYHFNMYDTMNRVRTLRMSDVIRKAGMPRTTFMSDTRKSPDIDASTGDVVTHIRTEESIQDRRLEPADPAMTQLYTELQQDQQAGTLSRLLLGGEIPSGAAFASINLVTHSAMGAIRPSQFLAQAVLADILETMLLWLHYTNESAVTYYTDKDGKTSQYLIDGEDVKPENVYITVELSADLPTDQQSRTVTARAQIDAGINSRQGAMEDIGIKDASEVQKKIIEERMVETMLETELRNESFMNDQQMRQELQQQVLQQIMSDPAFLQQVAGMMQKGERRPGEPPRGVQEFGGEMMSPETLVPGESNPAEGGPVPAEFNPGATREMQGGASPGEPAVF